MKCGKVIIVLFVRLREMERNLEVFPVIVVVYVGTESLWYSAG